MSDNDKGLQTEIEALKRQVRNVNEPLAKSIGVEVCVFVVGDLSIVLALQHNISLKCVFDDMIILPPFLTTISLPN